MEDAMNRIIGFTVLALMAAATPALAKGGGDRPENAPYALKERCDTLSTRYQDAVRTVDANSADVRAAKDAASEGGALCRSGRYEEGATTYEKALRLIGAPAN
jgi:hypothetical protein